MQHSKIYLSYLHFADMMKRESLNVDCLPQEVRNGVIELLLAELKEPSGGPRVIKGHFRFFYLLRNVLYREVSGLIIYV